MMRKKDKEIIHTIQEGIPLTKEPFREASRQLGVSQEKLVAKLKDFLDEGKLRRFGAKINQRKLGITANAVVIWKIPDDKLDHAIKMFTETPEISHCYERKTIPGRWEYNMYTVVHGYGKDEVEGVVKKLAEQIPVEDYHVLFSKRRFKGTSSKIGKSLK